MSGSSGIDALKLRLDRYATSIYKAKMENSTGRAVSRARAQCSN